MALGLLLFVLLENFSLGDNVVLEVLVSAIRQEKKITIRKEETNCL